MTLPPPTNKYAISLVTSTLKMTATISLETYVTYATSHKARPLKEVKHRVYPYKMTLLHTGRTAASYIFCEIKKKFRK